MRWFLIQSKPCREVNVLERLKAESVASSRPIETFFPVYAKKRAGGRGPHCALFPSYLFARFAMARATEVEWTLARRDGTNPVGHLVHFAQEPAWVADELIEGLRSYENPHGLIEVPLAAAIPVHSFQPGGRAMVTSGPLRGFVGYIIGEANAEKRKWMMLEALGRTMKVEVDVRDLVVA